MWSLRSDGTSQYLNYCLWFKVSSCQRCVISRWFLIFLLYEREISSHSTFDKHILNPAIDSGGEPTGEICIETDSLLQTLISTPLSRITEINSQCNRSNFEFLNNWSPKLIAAGCVFRILVFESQRNKKSHNYDVARL